MISWKCEICGAHVKEPAIYCPICGRRDSLSEIEVDDPTEDDLMHSAKYEEALSMMRRYEEGTPPITKMEGCGCEEAGKQDGKKKAKAAKKAA